MRNASRWIFASVVLSFLLIYPWRAAMADCEGVTMVVALKTLNASGVTGTGTLCITENGTSGEISAENLTPGNPYTTWFVYFDNPQNCINPGHCTPTDTVSPLADPEGVLGRFDSTIAEETEATFSGHVGIQPSSGSEIHIPVFQHGSLSADGHIRARQLLTPQEPSLGAPGLGTSSDGPVGSPVAVAIFFIP